MKDLTESALAGCPACRADAVQDLRMWAVEQVMARIDLRTVLPDEYGGKAIVSCAEELARYVRDGHSPGVREDSQPHLPSLGDAP